MSLDDFPVPLTLEPGRRCWMLHFGPPDARRMFSITFAGTTTPCTLFTSREWAESFVKPDMEYPTVVEVEITDHKTAKAVAQYPIV